MRNIALRPIIILLYLAIAPLCWGAGTSPNKKRIVKYLVTDYNRDPLTSLQQSPVNIKFATSPQVSNGISTPIDLADQPTTSIILKYTLILSSEFRWGSGGRLPGIRGGGGDCKASENKNPNCWHIQLGWRSSSYGSTLIRLPKEAKKSRTNFRLQRGVSIPVEMHLQLNTPGQKDAEARVIVNSTTVASFKNFSFALNDLLPQSFWLEAKYAKNLVPAGNSTTEQTILVQDVQVLRANKVAVIQQVPSPTPSAPSNPPLFPSQSPTIPTPIPPSPPRPSPSPLPVPIPSPTPTPSTPTPSTPTPSTPYTWVDLTPEQIRRTLALTSIFENANTTLQYGYCEDNKDGRGFTFGYCGFTTGTGDGVLVVKNYLSRKPLDTLLAAFVPALLDLAKQKSANTTTLPGFCAAINSLDSDPDFRAAQDTIQKSMYFEPAMKWSRNLGIRYGLTKGQIYDAIINHGEGTSDSFSLNFLVNDTNAAVGGTPLTGIDEVTWLRNFLDIREKKLNASGGKSAARRVTFYRALLDAGNIDMGGPIYIDRVSKPGGGWQISNIFYGTFNINSIGHSKIAPKRKVTVLH